MSRNRINQVGLDRLIRLEWLERTSLLVLAGNEVKAIKNNLQNQLQDSFRSKRMNVRGSVDKTITILMKVWLKVPPALEPFRVSGLELLTLLPKHQHISVHWGMIMAVYPFWFNVATQVGRLLTLQGSATAAHVQRRLREQYGDRETVSRRARYVLRSYLDWGVLQETCDKGIYKPGPSLSLSNTRLVAWIVEASLHARSQSSATLKEVLNSPGLFPFSLKPTHTESLLSSTSKIEIHRLGLNNDIITLQK